MLGLDPNIPPIVGPSYEDPAPISPKGPVTQ